MKKLMLKIYLDNKHVGYEWHVDGLVLHSDIRQPPDLSDKTWFSDITIYEPGSWYGCPGGCESSYIKYDSFLQGIEINGKWLFPEDEVVTTTGLHGPLSYAEAWFAWEIHNNDVLHPRGCYHNLIPFECSIA